MDQPDLSTFGERLERAWKKRGFKTQTAFGKKMGLKQPYVSKLKRGDIRRTPMIAKICRELRVPSQWLEDGEGPEPEWDNPDYKPVEAAPEREFSIEQAVMLLAAELAPMGKTTRTATASLLVSLTERPEEAETIGLQIKSVIETGKESRVA